MEERFVKLQRMMKREMDNIRSTPSHPWISTATGAYLSLLGLRGFWPLGALNASGYPTDLSGQLRTLTNNGPSEGGVVAGYTAPYLKFDGSNDYLSRADEAGLDILGTETHILSAFRGLTLGGWFLAANGSLPPASTKGLMAKYLTTGNQRSYRLHIASASSSPTFVISVDGTATTSVTSSRTLAEEIWYFIVGRFDPSTSLDIFVSGTWNNNVAAIPASIFNSTEELNISAYSTGLAASRFNGSVSHCFLCAAYLPDEVVETLYEITRGMFGV